MAFTVGGCRCPAIAVYAPTDRRFAGHDHYLRHGDGDPFREPGTEDGDLSVGNGETPTRRVG